MVFNEPVAGGPVFGPSSWAHDAIVCGESRGKLWRTKLIKTDSGYVAASQLLACLQMLTVDACVAPDGDLIVAGGEISIGHRVAGDVIARLYSDVGRIHTHIQKYVPDEVLG